MASLNIFLYLVIIFSSVIHEYSHAWMAYRLGDPTAKNAGRLTLNPLPHIDPFGTVLMPLFLLLTAGIFIGWAKPVPYNPYNLSDKRWGSLKVGLAGPAANILLAVLLGILLRFSFAGYLVFAGFLSPIFWELVAFITYINISLALFNLLPFPPLDGSKIFEDLFPRYRSQIASLGFLGVFLALALAFYFLPPLSSFVFRLITGQRF
ncbi:MAG: site-2 protease family protein [Patescibacteria group bacterium]